MREMVRYNRTINLNSRDLSQKKIDDIVSFLNSCTSIFGIPKIIQREFQIDYVSEDATN